MKVAIDPGHGMSNRQHGRYDPGAVHVENGVQYQEADIALEYGRTLRDIFNKKGHQVFMTRDDKQDHAPLGQRVANARNAGAQVLLSLHLNSVEDDDANGLEVLYREPKHKDLAQDLQTSLLKITGFSDRKVKKRTDLAILKFNGAAAMIELGFIANDANRAIVINPQKRQEICEGIANVIEKRFQSPTV
jgi:N-acetylmuramoyl-L-alanine amidase